MLENLTLQKQFDHQNIKVKENGKKYRKLNKSIEHLSEQMLQQMANKKEILKQLVKKRQELTERQMNLRKENLKENDNTKEIQDIGKQLEMIEIKINKLKSDSTKEKIQVSPKNVTTGSEV